MSLSSIWRWSTAKALTLSSPQAPWPFPRPHQGSRPLRFCGLQTPHPRGQSGQKPPLWGVLLGEGTSILWFLPAGSRLLSGQAPGFKTSYMCKNEDIPYVHQVPRPFPNPARCFSWRDPVAYINSGACFPRKWPGHCFLTSVERNLHGLGEIYFGSLHVAEQCIEINGSCNRKDGVGRTGPSMVIPSAPCGQPCAQEPPG